VVAWSVKLPLLGSLIAFVAIIEQLSSKLLVNASEFQMLAF
jgi:hypothetical protein